MEKCQKITRHKEKQERIFQKMELENIQGTFVFHNQDNDIEEQVLKSEEHFFYKPQELKKTFLKNVEKKKL